ncbi:MAG: ChaN family lipoprotein [Desulfobacterales bacterium]|nr:ChaN family lipoprotein [Desulfobacterales bacterium]
MQVLEALPNVTPGVQALGMEMFSRAQQTVLDRWVSGLLDEKAFLQIALVQGWGMDFDYYRDLLTLARDRRIPIIALNAEKDLVAALRGKPLKSSAPGNGPCPAQPDRPLPPRHGGGHLRRPPSRGHATRRVHPDPDAVGRDHGRVGGPLPVEPGGPGPASAGGRRQQPRAIRVRHPLRVFRRLPVSYCLIGGKGEIDIPPDKLDRLMDVELPDFPMVPYDFVAYLAYEDLPRRGDARRDAGACADWPRTGDQGRDA